MKIKILILSFLTLGVLFLTNCTYNLSYDKLEGIWVTDSIIIYRGGEKEILKPQKNADNISNQFICNPTIYEFNSQKQLLNYQLSDNEDSRELSEYSLNKDYLIIKNHIVDTIPFTYYSKDNKEVIKLDYIQNHVKKYLYLSKRKILTLNNNPTLSLEVYKDKLEDARRDFDEFGNYCRAFTKMTYLSGTLDTINNENKYYSNGLLPSLYILSLHGKQKTMANEIAKMILERPNKKFYAIELSTNDYVGFKARTYGIGYTHPMVEFELLKEELKKNISSLDKAYLNRDFALKWYDFDWSRMESSSGMSYADPSVERIYFDNELDSEIKEKLLLELSNKLKGSAQGNAYYCLFLMFKNDKYKSEEAKIYLTKSKNVFNKLNKTGHVQDMLELINENLNN